MSDVSESVVTESDVEQKIIYKLLTDEIPFGLGYFASDVLTKPDIRSVSIDKGSHKKLYYPDYVIIVNGLPTIIIEAKSPDSGIEEAAREGRLYATEINAQYRSGLNPCSKVLVCDGNELAGYFWDNDDSVFKVNIKKLQPADTEFESIISFASRNIIEAFSIKCLKSYKKDAIYFKPIFMLGGKSVINETVGQNSFGANVSLEYKYLFNPESAEDREAIVRNAYIASKRKQAHVSQIDKLVRAAIPRNVTDSKTIGNTQNPREIVDALKDTKVVKNEICLLIGSVGSGKSTFTDYLRNIALPDNLKTSTEWINVNLNIAPLSKDLIYKWIVEQVYEFIKSKHHKIDFDDLETLKKIYSKELSVLYKGTAKLYENDESEYKKIIFNKLTQLQSDAILTLKCVMDMLYTSDSILLVIVLDNCDKRSRDDQLLMFEVASWMKDTFSCMIFLPIRDTTYDNYYAEPPLDTVIKDLVFRVDPPLLQNVIYSRFKYALREIKNNNDKFYYYLNNNMRVECSREEVGTYIQCMVTSIFQNNLYRRIVTGLAGRNIRKGLEIFLDLCKSGHIEEDEIFKIRVSEGNYSLPHHVIAKILLKGNKKYYHDTESIIKNLFYCNKDDDLPDPFIRVSILGWLKGKYREYGPNNTKGYHSVSSLIKDLQIRGHSGDSVIKQLTYLVQSNCIYSESSGYDVAGDDLIAISPAGYIHLDLLRNINYLSTVSEDTLFRENQPAKIISENMTGIGQHGLNTFNASVSNASILLEYLTKYYQDYYLGNVKVLADKPLDDLVGIDSINDFVKCKVAHSSVNNDNPLLKKQYLPGTEVMANIVSVQDYGVFVEFDLGGKGLLHVSNFGSLHKGYLNECEEGDWIIAKIIEFNEKHSRFSMELIET